MINNIPRITARLSVDAVNRLLQHVGLPAMDLEGLGPRKRKRIIVGAILTAPGNARAKCEAITGHALVLANKGDFAEFALRAVCEKRPALLAVLDDKSSLEERILNLWYLDPKIVDRARNTAMAYWWREGRSHCSFGVQSPNTLSDNLDQAVEAIRSKIQGLQGGRGVTCDRFVYHDQFFDDDGEPDLVHHIAIYLETPASFLMEFGDDDEIVIPTLRREARELSISYNQAKGRLDVAGKGVGGAQIFRQIAEVFCELGVSGAAMTDVVRDEWPLHLFQKMGGPRLSPPAEFSNVSVAEVSFSPGFQLGGKTTIRSRLGQTAYDRMQELGITQSVLQLEIVRSVTLSFEALPKKDEDGRRDIRATLSWPNTLYFDGATQLDQRIIEAWLKKPPLNTAESMRGNERS